MTQSTFARLRQTTTTGKGFGEMKTLARRRQEFPEDDDAIAVESAVRLVGRRLRELRHACGWGQAELEARLGGHIGRSEISYLENGRRRPTLETLATCARAFEVEPAVLLLDPRNVLVHRIAVCLLGGQGQRCLSCVNVVDSNGPWKGREIT